MSLSPRTNLVALLFLLLATFTVAEPASPNWLQAGGDDRHSGSCGIVVGNSTPKLRWDQGRKSRFGAPVFVEGNRLVTTRCPEYKETWVTAQDVETGEELWARELPDRENATYLVGIRDGRVYVSHPGSLFALDLKTGAILWEAPLGDIGLRYIAFTEWGDPIVQGGSYCRRLDQYSGKEKWKVNAAVASTGAEGPVVHNGLVYYCTGTIVTPMKVHARSVHTGESIAEYALAKPFMRQEQVPPIISEDGVLFIMAEALEVVNSRRVPTGMDFLAIKRKGNTFKVLWKYRCEKIKNASHLGYAVKDGNVFLCDGNRVLRLDAGSGKVTARSQRLETGNYGLAPNLILTPKMLLVGHNVVTNRLFALTLDLETSWELKAPVASWSIAPGGLICVGCSGTSVRVYEP